MRGALICIWLLVPAFVAAYHYGPGQERLVVDDAAAQLRAARAHVEANEWREAAESYDAALALLPGNQVEATRRIRIERSKAQLNSGQLPEAYDDLTMLFDELEADRQADPNLVADAREALASAQYYLTWLLRLEGQPREEWQPEIEAARQNYRLLAESSEAAHDDSSCAVHQDDLEAAIRLERMDLSELQALPLPKQCNCCNSDKCKCRCKGKKKNESKNRSEDARGAGGGGPPDNRGS